MGYELGIIGAGNMAEAIARGVIARGVVKPEQIIAADVSPQRRELFQEQLKVRSVEDNREVAKNSRKLLLSIKPQQLAPALAGIGQVTSAETLIISIMAGISIASIARNLGAGKSWRIIRTMPNTPMLVGEGMVAMSPGGAATAADLAGARKLFEAAADVIEVPEDLLDAVTAVSGSGPAYFYFLVEQMIRAGTELGLSPEHARTLAIKTAVGTAKLLASSTETPQELRRRVTSPGGTTQAAIEYMESQHFPDIVVEAIKAAQRRGKELGQ